MIEETILLKLGEIVLKGLNKSSFEDKLLKNIRRVLRKCGEFEVSAAQSAVFVRPCGDADIDRAEWSLKKVFGVVTVSRACTAEKNIEDIRVKAAEYLRPALRGAESFKVEAKRSDKGFPLKSPQICEDIGGYLLEVFPHLRVDVHNPQVTVTVEVRDFAAYIRTQADPGAGGLPSGTGGKAMILISGGIDSPVAAWMMAKRGVELTAVHFASPPYTSERAEAKVHDLLSKVSEYSGTIELFTVPFTEIQECIHENCPEELFTLIMRRYMMKIAAALAEKRECLSLVTGESLAQVASQTMQAIVCTDIAANMPVFRPLIGMDKEEIIRMSRRLETYDISIRPYDDCCTVFTPRHPRTRPKLSAVLKAESLLPETDLVERAVNGVKIRFCGE